LEIESKKLNCTSIQLTVIDSPSWPELNQAWSNRDCQFYTWSNGTQTLQIIHQEKGFHIASFCGKHDTTVIISEVGGKRYDICPNIAKSDADFSQVTAVILDGTIGLVPTPDDCLGITLASILKKKKGLIL
jgi:hypothetical protein